jgi:Protein kinase domain
VSHLNKSASYCVNPDCERPYPQPWGNKFCNSCGAPIQLIDRYVPLHRLGSGGFAHIYTVWDEKAQMEKVLKVLIEDSLKARELFAQEASVLSDLLHPGVPKVDVGGYFHLNLSSPKRRILPCLVMEKIDGHNLEEILHQLNGRCGEDLVLSWLTQSIKILQELHKRQIIHRDIKPSNLMLRNAAPGIGGINDERLVLIDFGGAKQVNGGKSGYPSSSTRLFSSGYSPPEQVTGGNVGPSADFYALGRTMIELLTGKYPPDLEDPNTGELHWRSQVQVSPQLGDLLDEMVQEDMRSRPTSAALIHKRLTKISQISPNVSFATQVQKTVNTGLAQQQKIFSQIFQGIALGITGIAGAFSKSTLFVFKAIANLVIACFATVWAMILTGLGAAFGTSIGFFFAYHSSLGFQVSEFLSRNLTFVAPNSQSLVFVGAGLGTAWGLTTAGVFGQRRRYVVASLMGLVGYGFGWLFWELITPLQGGEGLATLILVAASLVTLGLGLRSHYLVYAAIGSLGTATLFAALIALGFPTTIFQFSSAPLWTELLLPLTFFSLMGLFLSFWLGVSHYVIVPGLKFLGWR